jgi:hypothetical protein
MNHFEFSYHPSRTLVRSLLALTAVGVLVCATGFAVNAERAWASVLLVSFWLTCMGLAGGFFVALQ